MTGRSRGAYVRILDWYALPAVAVLAVLLIANVIAEASFLTPSNWPATFATMAPFLLVAMAITPPIISGGGGVDLSVGPLAGFVGAVIVAKLVPNGLGDAWILVPIVVGIGMGIGFVNGILASYVRLPPIVATLGMYLILAGWTLKVLPTAGGTAPKWLSDLSGGAGPIPGTLVLVLGAGAAWTLLNRSAFGRNLLAVGGDDRAAFTAGIDVARVRLIAYVAAGAIAAVAGMAFVANLQSADPNVGPPYTLIALAAAPLGGVSLAGGRGGLFGAALGGATLFLVSHLLNALTVSAFVTPIAYGGMLIFALAANSLGDWKRRGRDIAAETAPPGADVAALGS
ncbi:MAG: ABC transporter permease [Actinobacteria bacterium]|nr:ABC transporter permease [Actinomycetota bacterium]OJU80827.1 MAG: hypothetical protein BGO11_19720 [Solirubrobacterales bacterium 70-9]